MWEAPLATIIITAYGAEIFFIPLTTALKLSCTFSQKQLHGWMDPGAFVKDGEILSYNIDTLYE
jgi:hypothetical protein